MGISFGPEDQNLQQQMLNLYMNQFLNAGIKPINGLKNVSTGTLLTISSSTVSTGQALYWSQNGGRVHKWTGSNGSDSPKRTHEHKELNKHLFLFKKYRIPVPEPVKDAFFGRRDLEKLRH